MILDLEPLLFYPFKTLTIGILFIFYEYFLSNLYNPYIIMRPIQCKRIKISIVVALCIKFNALWDYMTIHYRFKPFKGEASKSASPSIYADWVNGK